MAYVSSKSLWTWFSHLKETAYGTERANSAVFRPIGELKDNLFVLQSNPQFEVDMSQNAADEPTGAYITTNQFNEKQIVTYFSFQDIPYWLQMIAGVLGTVGSSAPYTHTITALDKGTTRQHPTRTFGQRVGSVIHIFPSVGIRELRIAKDNTGRLRVTITPHAQGRDLVNPASYVAPANVTDRIFAINNQVDHNITDSILSIDRDYKCQINTWEWIMTNTQLGDGYRDCSPNFTAGNMDSGQVKSEHLTAAYDWKVNLNLRLEDDDPTLQIMRATDLVTVSTAVTSTKEITSGNPYSMSLAHSKAQIMSYEDTPEQGGFVNRQVSLSLMSAADGTFPFTSEVQNGKSSYLI